MQAWKKAELMDSFPMGWHGSKGRKSSSPHHRLDSGMKFMWPLATLAHKPCSKQLCLAGGLQWRLCEKEQGGSLFCSSTTPLHGLLIQVVKD